MAEPLYYGFGKGCDFAKKSCKEHIQLKRNALVFLVKTVYIFTYIVTLGLYHIHVTYNIFIVKILRITITVIQSIVHCSKIEIRRKNQTYFEAIGGNVSRFNLPRPDLDQTQMSCDTTQILDSDSIGRGHLRFYYLVTMHNQLCPVVYAHHVLLMVRQCLSPLVYWTFFQDNSFPNQEVSYPKSRCFFLPVEVFF